MIKYFITTLALLFLTLPTLAAALVPDPILRDVEARYQKISAWRSDFSQTSFIDVLGQTLTKTGHITVTRPDKMRIDYASEPQKVYILNGKRMWVYQPATNSADKFDNPDKVISREALSFLSGLANLSELFAAKGDLKEPPEFSQISDAKLKKIALVPKDPDSPILRLTLGIDTKTLTLKEAILFNGSGNVTHYEFKNIEFDKPDAAEVFALPRDKNIKVTNNKNLD